MKVLAPIEDEEGISRILSHLNLLAPGDGPRGPPRGTFSGSASPACARPRELTYEPVYDLPVRRLPVPRQTGTQTGDLPGPDTA
jgi:hypothetical protein